LFSRASVGKQISLPQAPGLSLKLQENGKFKMKLHQILLFWWRAPGLCGMKGFKLEAPGKKGKLKMKLQQVLLFMQRAP